MTIFLGIFNFYFGDTPPLPPTVSWTQILIALIGPTLGFFTAWIMLNQTQRKNRENQDRDKKKAREEKYTYFVTMAKEVPKIIAGQVSLYKQHIETIKADPIKYYPPDSFIITTLKRLSEANDNEQYLHSFLSASKINDKQECTDLFKDLYSYIDYKYFTLLRAFEYHEDVRNEKEKVTEKYIAAVKDLEDYVGNYLRSTKENTTNKEEIVVQKIYADYCDIKRKSTANDFTPSYRDFAMPLALNLLSLNLEDYSNNSREVLDKSKILKNAYELFLHKNKFEISNFESLIEQLQGYDHELKAVLEKL